MGTGAGRAHAAVPTSSSHRPNRSYPDRGRAERAGRPRDSDGPAASPIRHPTARTALPDLSARSAVSSRPGRQSTRRCRATPRKPSAETLRPHQGRPSGDRRTGRVPGTARQSRVPARRASTAHRHHVCPSRFAPFRIAPRRFSRFTLEKPMAVGLLRLVIAIG